FSAGSCERSGSRWRSHSSTSCPWWEADELVNGGHMTFRPGVKLVSTLSALAFVTACGSGMLDASRPPVVTVSGGGGGGGGGSASAYTGLLGDSLSHGTVSFTVSSTLSASGTITFSGASPFSVSGTVDTVAHELHASGGGYTFTAFTDNPNGTLTGVFAGPALPGYFVAASDSLTGQTHSFYCGTYTSTNSNGKMTFQVLSGGDVTGYALQSAGTAQSTFLSGTLISNVQLTGVTDSGVSYSGTLSADQSTITGNYAPPVSGATGVNNATGTFLATKGGC